MRSLVFGPMPEGAAPATHIAAGPWCFAGREGLFPGWDGGSAAFPLPPDPFADAPSLDQAAKAANAAARRLALEYGARLGASFRAWREDAGDPRPRQGHDAPGPAFQAGNCSPCASEERSSGEMIFPGRNPLRQLGKTHAPCGLARGEDKALSEDSALLLFGPFFLLFTHTLIERRKRLLDLAARYGHEALRVPVLPPACPFSFQNSQEFMIHGVLDPVFNHYLYSRLLKAMAPPLWRLEEAAPMPLHQASKKHPEPLRARFRAFAARLLRDMPFPRYKGFSLAQAALLSIAALTSRQGPDRSLDFSLYCGKEPDWGFDINALARGCLPLDLCPPSIKDGPPHGAAYEALPESMDKAPKLPARPPVKPPVKPPVSGPLRGMTAAYMQDDRYRARLAALQERGCRLFAVQHGANYGNLHSVGMLVFEYSRHAFFTWGWPEHGGVPANAVPLPHPLLARLANRHRERTPALILVGAEMSALSYRLKSRPQAGGLPAYRRAKIVFLQTARDALVQSGQAAELSYRPYFAAPGALEDGPYVCRALPDIALCRGDLTQHMLSCRLLVLDHYGTTLHMALAANTPLMAYWDRKAWAMERGSEEALDALQAAGILFESAREAAQAAAAAWPDVAGWWAHPARQKARALWLERYVRLTDEKGRPLAMAALTRLWWRKVRGIG